jgi:hypothetical protein
MNNNFNVRQLVVSWISHLDSVPDLNMLEYLPEFLSGLFLMLANPNPGMLRVLWSASILNSHAHQLFFFLQKFVSKPTRVSLNSWARL